MQPIPRVPHRRPRPSARPGVTAVVCAVAAALGSAGFVRAEPPPELAPARPDVGPVDDAEFADVVLRTRLTQRFEIYNPHSREQLEAIRAMGFTQVILDWPNLHAEATALGLDVVLARWWSEETTRAEIEEGVALARQVAPGRLAALSMMDEPERHAPETPFSYYQALYDELRGRFDQERPGVQLEISHWGPLAWWTPDHYASFVPLYQACDRIRLMPYPDLDEGPLREVYLQMLRSRRLMQQAERRLPQIVILQTWVLPERPKLPTIDELRVMAYQAVLAGADTLSFYNYDPQVWGRTRGFPEGFARLMDELTSFCRAHRDATVVSRMRSNGVLEARLAAPGKLVLVTVNTNRTSVGGLAPLEVVIESAGVTSGCPQTVRRAGGRPRHRPFRVLGRWQRHCRTAAVRRRFP